MVEKAAADYSNLFRSVHPEKEIDPICANIEDMLARLDEFETLLSNIKAETNGIMENCIGTLNDFNGEFQVLRKRIDNLETFVNVVSTNVDAMERAVDIAEEELNVTNYSLKGLILKPLLNKTIRGGDGDEQNTLRSNLKDDVYQKVPIFKTSQYFASQSESISSQSTNNDNGDIVQS